MVALKVVEVAPTSAENCWNVGENFHAVSRIHGTIRNQTSEDPVYVASVKKLRDLGLDRSLTEARYGKMNVQPRGEPPL